jgi:polysaccharide export outer membrane protein
MKFNRKNLRPCCFSDRRTVRQSALLSLNIGAASQLLAAALLLLLNACASVATAPPSVAVESQKIAAPETSMASSPQNNSDVSRLTQLLEQRRQENFASDYPLGPGDVIEINVSGMDEIKNLTERVTGAGTISLPFVGAINVNGLTDKALREEIRRRLETNYMRNPHVNIFVKEFRSRQVAVVGAVQKPGLYNLASGADTIFDMISQAGGMRADAAQRILLIPADPVEPEKAKAIAATLPAQVISQDPSPLILKDVDPIVMNTSTLIRGGNVNYLALPARPGDVIMVPGAGEVLIQGWIEKPGSYKITPGLTLLGAVAAAGGPTFPADTGAVKVIRTNKLGEKTFLVANLESIQSGEQRDLTLEEGDVIDVSYSSPKLAAYGFYRFFSAIVRIGVGANARIPIGTQ